MRIVSVAALYLVIFSGCEPVEDVLVEAGELCSQPVFQVTTNTTGDDPNALCDTETGDCPTLISAFKSASFCSGHGPKTIELMPEALYEITELNPPAEFMITMTDDAIDRAGPSGLPLVQSEIVLLGNGATIRRTEGAPDLHLLHVLETGSLSIEELILEGGGGDVDGGAIYNEGSLDLRDTFLRDNAVASDRRGGALYNLGHLYAGPGTSFTGNEGSVGVLYQAGVDTDSSLDSVHISGNLGVFGGSSIVAVAEDAHLRIENSVLEDNVSNSETVDSRGSLSIDGSTFTRNTAINAGSVFSMAGRTTIERSTFSAEVGRTAGAIRCGASAEVALRDVTIADVSSENGFAVLATDNCVLSFTNTVLSGNTPADCGYIQTPTVAGTNVDSDGTCGGFTTLPDAGLQALSINGGITPTHQPEDSSPLIDAGGTTCLESDQRGEMRPAGAACDVGAVEAR